MWRTIVAALCACGPSSVVLDVIPATEDATLTAADVGSVEVIVLPAGALRCADTPGPYVTVSRPSLRRRLLATDALHLDDLPTQGRVMVLADLYRDADGVGDIVGSACREDIALSPGVRTTVRLRL